MSASTVARWNSIPMERPWDGPSTSFKRPRSPTSDTKADSDSEDDDGVSLVSRSPSPEATSRRGGDADSGTDVHMYDEHSDVRGVARERVTVDTKISSSNKGFALLAKMGWTEGKPVGISGDGRIDPVPFTLKYDASGLGKYRQDFEVIETTVSQRKTLDSERMQNETAEQRQQREAAVAQKAAVASEVSQTLRAFYCAYCDKQFANVAQYDEHTNSYAHHHKVRAKDMASHHPVRAAGKEEAEKRKEKERKREEKELKKIAKAAGIKISALPGSTVAPVVVPLVPSASEIASKAGKKSAWASVGGEDSQPMTSSASSGRAWATVSTPAQPAPPRNPAWQSASSTPTPEARRPTPSTNAFRSGGFTTLQTSINQPNIDAAPPPPPASSLSSQAPAPPPPGLASLPIPPPPPPSSITQPSASNASSFVPPPPSTGVPPPTSNFSPPGPTSTPHPPKPSPAQPPPIPAPPGLSSLPHLLQPPSQPPPPPPTQPQIQHQASDIPQPAVPVPGAEKKAKGKKRREAGVEGEEPQSRGNWQSFQRGRGRR